MAKNSIIAYKKKCYKCGHDRFIKRKCAKCKSPPTKLVEYKNKNGAMRDKVVKE